MRKACILVIEPHEHERTLVVDTLREAGYEVRSATDTLEGLQIMFESYPDVIVMNCSSSDVAGTDARLRVRQASYLPIIVVGDQSDAVESLEIGADAFMTTPTKPRELVARVQGLIARKTKTMNKKKSNSDGGEGRSIWN